MTGSPFAPLSVVRWIPVRVATWRFALTLSEAGAGCSFAGPCGGLPGWRDSGVHKFKHCWDTIPVKIAWDAAGGAVGMAASKVNIDQVLRSGRHLLNLIASRRR